MKIFEVIDLDRVIPTQHKLDYKQIIDVNPRDESPEDTRKRFIPISGDLLGKGVQGAAFTHKNRPGTVTKQSVVHSRRELDGYLTFVREIVKHQDNPFFPRIFNARLYRAENQRNRPVTILVMVMEKLVPLLHPKITDVVPHLFSQLGIDPTTIGEHRKSRRDSAHSGFAAMNIPGSEKQQLTQIYDIKLFLNVVDSILLDEEDIPKNNLNPKFVEAIKILQPLTYDLGADLHSGNMMVRLTAHGPQLVIVDPFAVELFDDYT